MAHYDQATALACVRWWADTSTSCWGLARLNTEDQGDSSCLIEPMALLIESAGLLYVATWCNCCLVSCWQVEHRSRSSHCTKQGRPLAQYHLHIIFSGTQGRSFLTQVSLPDVLNKSRFQHVDTMLRRPINCSVLVDFSLNTFSIFFHIMSK